VNYPTVVSNPPVLLNGIPSFNRDHTADTNKLHRQITHKPDNSPNNRGITAKTRRLRTDGSHENSTRKEEYGYISRVNRR
jgi:hypothetical protein